MAFIESKTILSSFFASFAVLKSQNEDYGHGKQSFLSIGAIGMQIVQVK